jgi:hypothetical protein
MKLTQAYVKELFDYHPDGYLTWKRSKGCANVNDKVGWINGTFYLQTKIDKEIYFVHKLVWLWHYGEIPTGMLDHINRVRGDNRIENLRLANASQNNWNSVIRKDNKSGYKGVYWHNQSQKWRAKICYYNKHIGLGNHDCPIEAAKAYDKRAKELFGEFANTNF